MSAAGPSQGANRVPSGGVGVVKSAAGPSQGANRASSGGVGVIISSLTWALRAHGTGWTLAAIASLLLAASPAGAVEGPPLSLGEALRLAVAQSPELAAQRAMADSASVGTGAAGALPDPKFKTSLENVPTNTAERFTAQDPVTMLKVGFSQEFPGGNKLELRTRRAELDAQRESVMSEVQRAAVQRDVAVAWVARCATPSNPEAKITDQISEAELAVETCNAQYRAGKATQTELIILQSAVVDLKNKRTDNGVAVKRARIALARLYRSGRRASAG